MNASSRMEQHALAQGSAQWLAHRMACNNASEAAAMLGCSPYTTRAELLRQVHTGLAPEVDASTQRLYDDGHRTEALLRPLAEQIVGEDLYAIVGTRAWPDIARPLGASYDGLTIARDVGFECKRLNEALRAALPHGGPDDNDQRALPKLYRVQVEQQFMVCPTMERELFGAGEFDREGNLVDARWVWCTPDAELRAEIVAGWSQFEADLAVYVPPEVVVAAVAAPIEALPAVSVRMDGALAVHSNLDVFGAKLREFIAKIPAKPTDDQEFADCDAACKALKRAEDALDGAEANALGQVQSVETLTRTIADLRSVARAARLAAEKMVKARKEQIRLDEVQRGQKALAEFIVGLNEQIGRSYMPAIPNDFAGAISGKKTLESLRAAVDQHLADKKIEASATAGRITINRRTLHELATDYQGLFPDTAALVLKAEDDFRAIVTSRIAEHKAAEERRLEQERERIRAEEVAKLKREQDEQYRREADEAARKITEGLAEARRTEALPADLIDAVASASSGLLADMVITRVAAAPTVIPMQRPTPAPSSPPTLRLGQINERLAPIALTAEGLRSLGFEHSATDKAAKLYHEHQFEGICESLLAHVRMAQARQQAA